jgi:molybdenum cofactor cytidylyltransferase
MVPTFSSDTAGYGAIVLAGGGCCHAGELEQLRLWEGEPVVRRAARTAVGAGLWPVVVVVGERADAVRAALAGLPVATVADPDHEAGLAGALRRGLARLSECAPQALGALFPGCDQPLVVPAHLSALAVAARDSGRPIAASAFGGGLGLPVLVARTLFDELLGLPPGVGAPALADLDPARVVPVPLPGGEVNVEAHGRESGPTPGRS